VPRGLTPEWRIQKFLDGLDYDVDGRSCRSPRRVLRERRVQCLDGALFAAAALRRQGHRPWVQWIGVLFEAGLMGRRLPSK
jgi:hypothetical protein